MLGSAYSKYDVLGKFHVLEDIEDLWKSWQIQFFSRGWLVPPVQTFLLLSLPSENEYHPSLSFHAQGSLNLVPC